MKKEIFSNVFVIVLTAIFILCANFAYYDMTNLKMNWEMHANILQVQDVVHILMPNIIELLGVLIPNVRRRKPIREH